MLRFNSKQTQEQKDQREARYAAMTEKSLRDQVARFSGELKEKRMDLLETHFKTNSLQYAVRELTRRGLPTAPITVTLEKNRLRGNGHFFITMELDEKRLKRHFNKLVPLE